MSAPVDEYLRRIAVDLDNRAISQQTAEGEGLAFLAAHSRDHTHSGGLGVDHADGSFVGDDARDNLPGWYHRE